MWNCRVHSCCYEYLLVTHEQAEAARTRGDTTPTKFIQINLKAKIHKHQLQILALSQNKTHGEERHWNPSSLIIINWDEMQNIDFRHHSSEISLM